MRLMCPASALLLSEKATTGQQYSFVEPTTRISCPNEVSARQLNASDVSVLRAIREKLQVRAVPPTKPICCRPLQALQTILSKPRLEGCDRGPRPAPGKNTTFARKLDEKEHLEDAGNVKATLEALGQERAARANTSLVTTNSVCPTWQSCWIEHGISSNRKAPHHLHRASFGETQLENFSRCLP